MLIKIFSTLEIFVYFLLAIIFALPNLALFITIASIVLFHNILSVFFCIVFAYKITKKVKYAYERFIEKKSTRDNSGETVFGSGYHYTIQDDAVTFTFENVANADGRAIERLKFIREKDFRD